MDQIASQIVVAVASGELAPGHRLPSIRGLAARLKVHPNSVRAAYEQTAARGWIEVRAGSGSYVSRRDVHEDLATLARRFLSAARELGADDHAIRQALETALLVRVPNRLLVVEPEDGLREILMAEIGAAVPLGMTGAPGFPQEGAGEGTVVAALAARAATGDLHTYDAPSVVWLQVNSAADLLKRNKRPSSNVLVMFASRSPALLRIASAVLVGAGWDPGALLMQDARQPGWKRSLRSSQVIIADSITIGQVPAELRPWHLRVIAENSLRELAVRCGVSSDCDSSGSVLQAGSGD